MINLERFQLQLNNKNYMSESAYCVYLEENGLDPYEIYTTANKKPLLYTVLSVLDTLSNNIDLFCSVETEFSNTTEAFSALSRRIVQVKNQINALDDTGTTTDNTFSIMYFGGN